MTLVGSGSTR